MLKELLHAVTRNHCLTLDQQADILDMNPKVYAMKTNQNDSHHTVNLDQFEQIVALLESDQFSQALKVKAEPTGQCLMDLMLTLTDKKGQLAAELLTAMKDNHLSTNEIYALQQKIDAVQAELNSFSAELVAMLKGNSP